MHQNYKGGQLLAFCTALRFPTGCEKGLALRKLALRVMFKKRVRGAFSVHIQRSNSGGTLRPNQRCSWRQRKHV